MIITKSTPFSTNEINKLKENFDVYIKTVIDIEKKVCCAGMDRHIEGEKLHLINGSAKGDIWGGGIDLETKKIDYYSFINAHPDNRNAKNSIEDENVKKQFLEIVGYFFGKILL